MAIHKRLFVVTTIIIFNILYIAAVFPAQRPAPQPAQQPTQQLAELRSDIDIAKAETEKVWDNLAAALLRINKINLISREAAEEVVRTRKDNIEAITRIEALRISTEQVQGVLAAVGHSVTNFAREVEQVSIKEKAGITAHAAEAGKLLEKSIDEAFKKNNNPELAKEKAKIMAQIKWEKIQEIISDPKLLTKIAITIVVIALCIYILKYGLPVLVNYLTRPRVISETSRPGLFEWFKPKQTVNIDDLIFTPSLQNQLFDLLLRVQTAKKYNEGLPNVLFHGAPGTGKTAFVKALAYESGLDYALTSGSEFAKITDLNQANNELRKLLNWAKRSKNGLIVFIDEAESLFANRKLQTTSKATQDFINTFLSLVSDQSQKKVMFIFATNHPFKLDDAITNRVGINIEFTLPEAPEREKILSVYLVKSAQENEAAIVDLHPDVIKLLPMYADELKGFSPRAIKFVAEEMIINARRQESMQLTNDIAQAVMDQAKHSLRQAVLWETERKAWSGDSNVIH